LSPKIPRITSRDLIAVLRKRRFLLVRSSGSHHVFRDTKGNHAVVPVHAGKIIKPKTLSGILRDADIPMEEFIEDLK
jgi:predicted RNA binding protein YcfA (HicA-like mRNA interferase family)